MPDARQGLADARVGDVLGDVLLRVGEGGEVQGLLAAQEQDRAVIFASSDGSVGWGPS